MLNLNLKLTLSRLLLMQISVIKLTGNYIKSELIVLSMINFGDCKKHSTFYII